MEADDSKPWREFYPFDSPRLKAGEEEEEEDRQPSWKSGNAGFSRSGGLGFHANINPWAKWDAICDVARNLIFITLDTVISLISARSL